LLAAYFSPIFGDQLFERCCWRAELETLFFLILGSLDSTCDLLFIQHVPWLWIMVMPTIQAVVTCISDDVLAWAVALHKVVGFVVEFADRLIDCHAANFSLDDRCGAERIPDRITYKYLYHSNPSPVSSAWATVWLTSSRSSFWFWLLSRLSCRYASSLKNGADLSVMRPTQVGQVCANLNESSRTITITMLAANLFHSMSPPLRTTTFVAVNTLAATFYH